jgi:hypothetical protein
MPDYQRKLPHFHPNQAYLFLTWKLWGSQPGPTQARLYRTPGHAFVAQDRELDRQSGARWLKDPLIADIVAQAI